MLKKKMFVVVLGAFLFTGLAISQPPTKEQKLDLLSKKLDLNAQQIKAVDQILTGLKKQLDQLRERRWNFDDQAMKDMKQIFDKEDAQIEKKLTDSQKKLFAELKKERENNQPPMGPPREERREMPLGPPPSQGR